MTPEFAITTKIIHYPFDGRYGWIAAGNTGLLISYFRHSYTTHRARVSHTPEGHAWPQKNHRMQHASRFICGFSAFVEWWRDISRLEDPTIPKIQKLEATANPAIHRFLQHLFGDSYTSQPQRYSSVDCTIDLVKLTQNQALLASLSLRRASREGKLGKTSDPIPKGSTP